MMTEAEAQLIEEGRAQARSEGGDHRSREIEPWVTDWRGRVHGASPAILAPASTEEVVEIVQLAAEHRVPLVPQGGNTGMAAGATPPADGSAILLSMRRMNRIRSIERRQPPRGRRGRRGARDAARRRARGRHALSADAGRARQLHDRRADLDQRRRHAGAEVRNHALARRRGRSGAARRLLHNGLSGLKKDNRGYSLDQLLIGAEGTLGVVTAVALRLVPAIAARAVAWTGVDSPQGRSTLLRFLEARTDSVEGFELVPAGFAAAGAQAHPGHARAADGAHPGTRWSRRPRPMPAQRRRRRARAAARRRLQRGIIADAVLAANEAQAEAFWKIRDTISEAERAEGQTLAHDISVPVADMPRFIIEAAAEVERLPGRHRQRLRPPRRRQHPLPRPRRRATRRPIGTRRRRGDHAVVDDLVTAAGGSISAEHGIGQLKRRRARASRAAGSASMRCARSSTRSTHSGS